MKLVHHEPDSGLWTLCDQSQIAHIPGDIPQMLQLAKGRCLQDAGISPLLINWIDKTIDRWGFGEHFLADFIEGLVVIPLLLELKSSGYYCPGTKNLELSSFSAELAVAIKKLFVEKGWGEERRDSVLVTPAGAYLIDRLMNAGTVMSYAPMLSQMDTLLYGDSDNVFTRDELTGHENHIERTLNVVASGFQHEKYFKDIEKTVLSIFDTQNFSAQPNYIADMGCGDGSLLKKVYEIIVEKSARGKQLEQFPLTLIGVDYNDKALVATAENLAGLPFITLHGDIGDPAQLEQDLKSKVSDVADILHVRSFLDHDRPFIVPSDSLACENKKTNDWQVLSVGVGGDLVEPAVAIQSLVEHFSRWAQLKSKHGMLVLEVHSVPTEIAGEYMDECESLHFDAYHAFSRQHLVDAEHFSIAASEAGWFPDLRYSRFYSKVMPYKRITLNMLQQRSYSIRYACQADLLALAELDNVVAYTASGETLTQEVRAELVREYPQGQYVLILDQQIVAACFTYRDTLKNLGVEAVEPRSRDEQINILGIAFAQNATSNLNGMIEFVEHNSKLKSGVESVQGRAEIEYSIRGHLEKRIDRFSSILSALSSYQQSYPSDEARNTIKAELEIAVFAGRCLVQWVQAQGLMHRAKQHYSFTKLISDLNVQQKYHRLFRALLNMLEGQQVLSINGDAIITLAGIEAFAVRDFDAEALAFEQHITANYPGITAFWHLTKRCLFSYGQILNGTIASNDVVFKDGSMELFAKIFKGNPVADYYNELLAESILAMLSTKRAEGDQSEFRVLEVGAGTGGASEFVLRKLAETSQNIIFYYTDISSSFTRYGRERFAKDYPWVRFQKLDIGKNPELQGYELESFDAVFAFNVLHDTELIHTTLAWINRLLKVGGLLLMNEYTRVKDMLLFSGGLLHGLWIYKDAEYRIEHSCFLSINQWQKVAKATGYSKFSAFGDPHLADVNDSWQSVMLCQKTDQVDMSVIEQKLLSSEALQEISAERSTTSTNQPVIATNPPAPDGRQYESVLGQVFAAIYKVKEDIPAGTIQTDSPIMELGLDSIELVELRSLLNKSYTLKLSTSEFFTHSTPEKITRHICVLKGQDKSDELYKREDGHSVEENKVGLVEQLKEILSRLEKEGVDQNVNTDLSFMEMGLDSIELVELRSLVNKAFGLKLATSVFFKYTHLDSLAEYLLELIPTLRSSRELPLQIASNERLQSSIQPPREHTSDHREHYLVESGKSEIRKCEVREPDIAIIGLALHFPGEVNSREQLWQLLSQGDSAIGPLSKARWTWPESVDVDGQKSYLKQAGFASDIDQFDADFFHISPKEAELMDPQQRMVMQLAWQAVEDAGYKASSLRGSNTGVYIGACHFDYSELAKHRDFRDHTYVSTGTNSSLLANRVSYFFDFQGPSMMIDTACSSSLVAVHDAVTAIRRGDCQQALVGGVNLICTPTNTLVYDKANILSKNNRCATFDKQANGFVRGEGGAVFMLKPMRQAVADGDLVSAIIKGSAVNHGGQATSLTAPNPDAQARLIVKALEDADASPDSISYIEAHGTGTALGDPVEVLGLKQAFSDGRFPVSRSAKCGLGTIKSNIGHLEGAAGVAGMMKVLVSLSNRLLPPSLHYQDLNPEISFNDTPFYVVDTLRPWTLANGSPVADINVRRAGVSSFGFGGANAHVILEEYNLEPRGVASGAEQSGPQLLLFSAKSSESLERYIMEFRSYISATSESLADIAYSLVNSREAMSYRLAFVADNKTHAAGLLDGFSQSLGGQSRDANLTHSQSNDAEQNALNKIFQGKTGQQLLNAAISERSLDLVAQAWNAGVIADFSSLYDNNKAKRVRLPVYQFSGEKYWLYPQTASAERKHAVDSNAFSIGSITEANQKNQRKVTLKLSASHPVFAQHTIGGERVCAGVVVVEMVLTSLRRIWPDRSFSLQNMTWRKPIVIEVDQQEICIQIASQPTGEQSCLISAKESPEVIYCQLGAIETGTLPTNTWPNIAELKKGLPLSVESESELTAFYTGFRQLTIHHGAYYRGIKKIWGHENEMLAYIVLDQSVPDKQFLLHPVIADSALQAISGLANRKVHTALLPFSVDAIRIFSEPGKEIYVHAIKTNNGLYDVSLLHKDGQQYALFQGLNLRPFTPNRNGDDAQDFMLLPTWRKSKGLQVPLAEESYETGRAIAFCTTKSSSFKNKVFDSLDIYYAVTPGGSEDQAQQDGRLVDFSSRQSVAEFLKNIEPIERVYFCAAPKDSTALNKCFTLLQALTDVVSSAQVCELVVAIFDTQKVCESDQLDATAAGIIGLTQCFSLEYARWRVRLVDFNSTELDDLELGNAGPAVLQQCTRQTSQLCAFRAGHAYVQELVEIGEQHASRSCFRQAGTYLIVGGAGALGLQVSQYLIQEYDARCIWLGRRSLNDEIIANQKSLSELGHEPYYIQADVTDSAQMKSALDDAKSRFGSIHGVLHSAAVLDDRAFASIDAHSFQQVYKVKQKGSQVLGQLLRNEDLDFLCFFSSIRSFFPQAGQSNYAAACTFQDVYAASLRSELKFPVHVVNWGYWRGDGLAKDYHSKLQAQGLRPMPVEKCMAWLEVSLFNSRQHALIFSAEKSYINSFGGETGISSSLVRSTPVPNLENLDLNKVAENYLVKLVSESLKLPKERVFLNKAFEEYGIDSMMIISLTESLERMFDKLPSSLFFEHRNLRQLAAYFSDNYSEILSNLSSSDELVGTSTEEPNFVTTVSEKSAGYEARIDEVTKPDLSNQLSEKSIHNGDIAIIGLSGRYPQAANLDVFWENLKEGRDCITEIPESRWDFKELYQQGKIDSKWGGFIQDVDKFDPLFFNISPREAEHIDPQERIFLETVWEAMEDAGYTRRRMSEGSTHQYGSAVGVFVGVMYEEYKFLGVENSTSGDVISLSAHPSSIANRVSFHCNFRGPSMAVDTMCSSSLTAIHLACQSLRGGECEYALAGGVNLNLHPDKYIYLAQGKFASSDGRCRSFGEGGDGFVPSEGVGAVLLKPLKDAIEDNDQIYAVIKGSSVNHGGKTNGYTVPDPTAQAELIQTAIQNAGVAACDFSYVETHGTGTPLGDPVELSGLSKAISDSARGTSCAIGSVKSNIGHCESAAGIAALTKVLLQLKHKQLVPSIHSDVLNKNIDFSASAFKVQRNLEYWPRLNDTARLAGISGFGAGGSNAHLIVQEYERPGTRESENNSSHVFNEKVAIVLSAKNEQRLCAYAEALKRFLEKTPLNEIDIRDLAYTLQIGREALNARLVFLVENIEQLLKQLQGFIDGDRNAQDSYSGMLDNAAEAQEQLESDQRSTESIKCALENGQLEPLAREWVRGAYIDWSAQQPISARLPKVISLPTYPFARNRYWVPLGDERTSVENRSTVISSSAKLHPLVHKNISTIGHQCFSSVFSGQEFFFHDHRVGHKNIMPAAALLEMARAAKKLSIGKPAKFIMEDILFVAPLEASATDGAEVKITVESCASEENNFGYTIFSDYHDNRQLLHSSGKFAYLDLSQQLPTLVLDLESIKRRCHKQISGQEIYSKFRENNFHYGPSFSVLRKISYNQTEAFSTIEFPVDNSALDHSYVIHPSIMDGALQSLIGVLNSDSENNQIPLYVPFSISSIRVFHALPSRAYVYAVRDQSNKEQSSEFIRFDIQLVDQDSRVLLEAKEVVYRKMKKAMSEQHVGGSSLLGPRSESVATDLQTQRNIVESTFCSIAVAILKLDGEELRAGEELINYGFDSVTFTEFAIRISSEFGVELKPTVFFDYHTLAALTDYFIQEHGHEIPQSYQQGCEQNQIALKDDSLTADAIADIEKVESIATINDLSNTAQEDPVAIIGVSGVMPQSSDLDEFWHHLANRESLITEVPASRWDWSQHYGDAINDATKTNSKWGGFIRDVDKFDPAFFNMSPTEAKVMDPQQRLFLQEVWKCIEDAGYAPSSLSGRKVAVYVGMQFQEYQSLMFQHSPSLSAHMATGNAHAILPNRVSYLLNLTGPSEAIDTACSSSLVAIHRAVQSIKTGEVATAIAGGVSLALSPETYVLTSQMGAYSPNGRCKTFDKGADGYVKGEGLGAVLLKRLSCAKADGDHIYAVIKSSVLNHGGKSQSLTAPSSAAQANLLFDAYDQAQIDPRTIAYIETHGTGTSLGDPIEVEGLKTAFKKLYEKYLIEPQGKAYIGLGAVKTNTGHLEPAAGMAGLFKVLMAMKHKLIPANANFEELNPYIKLRGSPFYIQKENTPWLRQRNQNGVALARRAGLSSFGFGGVNGHLVLEDMSESVSDSAPPNRSVFDQHIIVLSAKTENSLLAGVHKLHCFVMQSDHSLDMSSLAFTLQTGRDPMQFRLVILAKTKEDLSIELEAQSKALHSTQASKFVKLQTHEINNKVQQSHAVQTIENVVDQWLSGDNPDWYRLYKRPYPRRISLPTYSFEKKRYWFSDSGNMSDDGPIVSAQSISAEENHTTANIDRNLVYMTPTWLEDKSFNPIDRTLPLELSRILVFSDDDDFVTGLKKGRDNLTLIQVCSGDHFAALSNHQACLPRQCRKAHFEQLFSDLATSNILPEAIIVDLPGIRWNVESNDTENTHHKLHQCLYLSQALIEHKAKHASILYLSASGELDYQPQNRAFSGFTKTLELEESGIKAGHITVTQQANSSLYELSSTKVMSVIHTLNDSPQQDVLYSLNKRWLAGESLVSNTASAAGPGQSQAGLKEDGVYLLTGGAGGLGLIFAEHIVRSAKRAKLILMGRTQPSNEILERIISINPQAEVHFSQGDVTLLADVQQVVDDIQIRFGALNGVVHCAGVLRDKLIRTYDEQSASAVLAPKLDGTHNLDLTTRHIPLDFMLYCSSLAAIKGNVGQSVYAYANFYMDEFAQLRNSWVDQGVRHGATISINWPLWADGGMTVDEHIIRAIEKRLGLLPLTKQEGLLAFDFGLRGTVVNYYPKVHRTSYVAKKASIQDASKSVVKRPVKNEDLQRTIKVHTQNFDKQNSNTSANRANTKQLMLCTTEYLGNIFEQELHAPIAGNDAFEESGVDSFISIKIINKLEKQFGKLKKTLLFEYFTIATLAEYLLESQTEKLLEMFPEAEIETSDSKELRDVCDAGFSCERAASQDQVETMLVDIFSEVSGTQINPSDHFEEAGIDSFLSIKALRALESIFGKLSKTLLFEHFSIEKLAHFFIENHRETLLLRFGDVGTNGNESANGDQVNLLDDTKTTPLIITEGELESDKNLKNVVDEILALYGNEGTVARATPLVAPTIFLGSQHSAFFRISRQDNMVLVWSYAGPEEEYINLVTELTGFAKANKSELNILSTRWLETVGDVEFSSTPFGALQQIPDISDFNLSGKKMRRLRYSVNKFRGAGRCETREYTIGSDKSIDDKIIALVDEWCKSKQQVNPSIAVFKNCVQSGHLEAVHRVFLTYIDGLLVNAILITKMVDGYLMDMEFYPKDMPYGGLEFAITEIISLLKREGCRKFSLGGTYGPEIETSPNADTDVREILEQIREGNDFSQGNLQFKNKFRTLNSPIYLCKPVGGNASNVLDILMLIADPQAANDSSSIDAANNAESSNGPNDATAEGLDSELRLKSLEENGYNPALVPSEHIACDLMTDSWLQLQTDYIVTRHNQLVAKSANNAQALKTLLTDIFGFENILAVQSGRDAEALLCESWSRDKANIVQNLLFPTWIFTQIEQGFNPVELPNIGIFSHQNKEMFRGGVAIQRVRDYLNEHANDVGMLCLELADNAAGGYPVSLSELEELRQITKTYNVPLVLDVTRILDNAICIQRTDSCWRDRSIWEITKKICDLADAITGSLGKNFCVTSGGVVAARDERLFEKVVACSLEKDSNLTEEQKDIVANGLQDRGFIEDKIKTRVDAVTVLWSVLDKAGMPVMEMPGAHCVLIDVSRIPAFANQAEAQSAFICWLYQSTGVRAGLHSVGMQKNTTLNHMVRLAVPVGLPQQQIATFSKRITDAFSQNIKPLELMISEKSTSSFGHMDSRFEVVEPRLEVAGEQPVREQDVAIVGLAGRYPMANNIDEYWKNLAEGRDCISDIPEQRLKLRFQSKSDQPLWGGYIDDIDKFDAAFFKVAASEAKNIDPQERLFLQVAWQALEDAGYYPESLIDALGSNNIGIYAGVVWSQYHMLALDNNYSSQLSTQFGVSNRASYFMNFSGPSLTLNSACTSSLNALKLAYDSIVSGQIKAAIAGGVNLDIHPSKQDALISAGILSTSGRCRSFADDGDGYVTGEGVGAVLLKPLSQALKDKDNIYTVIKSVESNHTGSSSGYGVPNPHAQSAVVEEAIKQAGVSANTISFIEAHGTGTELGDSLEVLALNNALRSSHLPVNSRCAIASVKSNIGHLEAAAGIASVTKVALQFRHKQLVPSLHSAVSRGLIDSNDSLLRVQHELADWTSQANVGEPLRAGLNAFGDGGSNVHMVFEEYRACRQYSQNNLKEQAIPLSANSQMSLNEAVINLASFLRAAEAIDISNIAYTLQIGRKPMRFRAVFRAHSVDDLLNKLEAFDPAKDSFDVQKGTPEHDSLDVSLESAALANDPVSPVDRWLRGGSVDWQTLYQNERLYRISLPVYSFVKDTHWVDTELERGAEQVTSTDNIRPSDGVEEELARIWEQVLELKVGTVGATDRFFEMGGDSLSALSVLSKIREEFQRELAITTLFTHPTVTALASVINNSCESTLKTVTIKSIGAVDCLPQSYPQKSLWLIDQINGADANYNIGISIRISGTLDVAALRNCFSQLVQQHEIFRTSFSLSAGVPSQKIAEISEFSLPLINVREHQVAGLVSSHFQEIFSLEEAPLITAKLFCVSSELHTLSINMHHIISDAWSLGLMFGELNSLYRGQSCQQSQCLQYKDYAAWQHDLISPNGKASDWQKTMLDYWDRSLAGTNFHLPLPYDNVDSGTIDSSIGNQQRLLDSESTLALKELSLRSGTTLFSTLFSALSLLLSRWCQCDDMVIGTVVAGRNSIETETMFGCFMNFLALRTTVDQSLTVKQFIKTTSAVVLEGLRHQECPFEKVVERVNPKTRMARSPLYNVSLRLQNKQIEKLDLPDLVVEDVSVVMGGAQLDLMFEAIETDNGLELNIQYDRLLFASQTIEDLLTSFETVLTQMPLSEDAQLTELNNSKAVTQRSQQQISELKLVVCSSFTAEPLADSLVYLAEKIDCPVTLEFAPYNQTLQQLLDPTSLVSTNESGVNLFLIRIEDWCVHGCTDGIQQKISEFTQILSQSASNYSRPYIVQFCPISADDEHDLSVLCHQFEKDLIELSKNKKNIYVLTTGELNRLYPVTNAHNPNSELEGHIPYTKEAYFALGTLALRKLHSIARKEHKVIVLDCDNTLWRGVCGELGAHGVEVSPPFMQLQHQMLRQKQAGKLLCLCSKNNPEAVSEVFSKNSGMVLSMDDIVSSRINWSPKSENIQALAKELNLGLDSFVFIDDDPVQCAEVRSRCPQVQTIELPWDESQITHFIDHIWALDIERIDANRVDRTLFYKQNQERHHVQENALNLDDFIASLKLKIAFSRVSSGSVARAAELTLRTNQFNCGGKRYKESELIEHLKSDQANGFIVDVSDRYGDYGVVGLCLFEERESSLVVDTFLLSCRAMGRGIEHAMVSHLGGLARDGDCSEVCIQFTRSEKNQPALNFLTTLGLTDSSESLVLATHEACVVSYQTNLSHMQAASDKKSRAENSQEQPVSVDYQYIASTLGSAKAVMTEASLNTLKENVSAHYERPGDDIERQISEIWANALSLNRVGVNDDFFEIGGTSLQAAIVIAEIYSAWGVKLLIKQVFESPTVAGISDLVKNSVGLNKEQETAITPIRSKRIVSDEEDAYEL